MCLPLLGLGEVLYKGQTVPAADVLREKGWEPLTLMSKEGLALLNGTQFMSAHATWAVHRARHLYAAANKIAALSLEAFDGRIEPFGHAVNAVRNHPGQVAVADEMRALLTGSQLIAQHKQHVQDPYPSPCIPVNSPNDNPTIFPDDDIIVSAGNFHGEPIALPMDYLSVAMSELSNISERRIYKLVSGTRGLPSFLVAKPGLNSGFMIAQYAAASVLNQSKGLCWPTSCDSVPSSQGQEDHVSMGANSATKLIRVVENTARILGIEMFTAAQAFEFRRPLRSSEVLEALFTAYRAEVPFLEIDTVMSPLIEKSVNFVKTCI